MHVAQLKKAAKKLVLRNRQSPGDILMLTAAVRDLHLSHPGKFLTTVDTPFPDLWRHNRFVTRFEKEDEAEILPVAYPAIHESNEGAYHFIHAFRLDLEAKLGIKIKQTKFWGDIHLSLEERRRPSLIEERFTRWDTPFWLICTGGKKDFTAKWWIPEYAQEVVDHFKDRIQFVQFGEEGPNHVHPPLRGVINVVGKTGLRAFMNLVYHASGIVCPVTFAMHLAAATPAKSGLPRRKACVVTAGGREPSVFTAYTNHVYLHANGQMKCCENGGCWRNRTVPLNDGDEMDKSTCLDTVEFGGRKVQRCMHDLVRPADVIRAMERYYEGGALAYMTPGIPTIQASWEDRVAR
jgi:hypothetical protein